MARNKQDNASQFSSRLGYAFKDAGLLALATTHGSSGKKASYERLEFLGDRVLGLVIAEALYRQHGRDTEGKLSARHSTLVRGDLCAEIAGKLGFSELLQVGLLERKQGMQNARSLLADAMEAVIGAIYLDGGLEAAKQFVLAHWDEYLSRPDTSRKDAKTFVQEWALARGKVLPVYELVGREGPEHKPEFTVRLTVASFGQSEGRGSTKQAAEMAAAEQFIQAGGLR